MRGVWLTILKLMKMSQGVYMCAYVFCVWVGVSWIADCWFL